MTRYFAVISFVLFSLADLAVAAPQALYAVEAPDEPIVIASRNYEALPPIIDCLVLQNASQRADCLDPTLLSPQIKRRAIVAPGDAARKVCNLGLEVAEEQIHIRNTKSSFIDYVFYDPPGITRLSHYKFATIPMLGQNPHSKTLELKLGPNQSPVSVYALDFAGSRFNFVWHLAVPVPLSGTLKAGLLAQPNDQRPPYRWYQYVVANTRHPNISYSLGITQNREAVSMSEKYPILYDAANTAILKDNQTKSEIVVVDGIAYLRALAKFTRDQPHVTLFAFADDGNLDVLCWSRLGER